MRLLGITDLHNASSMLHRILQQAGPVDVVLLGGDITNFGTPEDAQQIVCQVLQTGCPVLAVAGNCDSSQIEQKLQELQVSLYRRGVVYRGVGFQGLSAMPPWKSRMYHFSEDQLADDLLEGYRQLVNHKAAVSLPPDSFQTFSEKQPSAQTSQGDSEESGRIPIAGGLSPPGLEMLGCPCSTADPNRLEPASPESVPPEQSPGSVAQAEDSSSASRGWGLHIVLSHVPPRDCKLDRTFLGRHVGSQALRRFIDQVQPDLVVCGHIHEGRGVDRIGRTWILNCGSAAGGSYGLVEILPELHLELHRL